MTQLNKFNITANSIGFSSTDETINVDSASAKFTVGDRFYYYVPSANTPIAPLSGNTYYYVSFVNSSAIAVSGTMGGANINITDSRTSDPAETHQLQIYTPWVVNVGQANNDHSGDPLRRAMQKINQNFSDIYSSIQPNTTSQSVLISNTVTLGNASVYATVNSSYYTGASYNALQLDGVDASHYIQNNDSRTLSGNLQFTASNVTFTSINVGGNTLIANSSGFYTNGTINATAISVTGLANVASLNVTGEANIAGNLVINGTLLVAGNTTYVNATVIQTTDKNLWLANDAATALAADGAGILIGTYANLVYNSSNDAFQSNAGFIPSVNNLSLGTNSNLWDVTANNVTSFNIFANTKIQVGNAGGYDFGSNAVIEVDTSANNYQQIVMQNANTGNNASGDLVITADTGNDVSNYVDLGINSSTYNNSGFTITGALDAYLYSSNSNLSIGTASNKDIVFHAGGTLASNRVLTINSTAVTVANGQTLSANLVNISTINAASHTVGTSTVANSTGVYTGIVNATSVNAASHTVGTSTVANSTGVYTGIVNATSFTATDGNVNVAVSTSTYYVGNSIANTTITANGISILANGQGYFRMGNTTVNTVVNATSVYITNSTGSSYLLSTGVYTTGIVNATSFNVGDATSATGGIYSNATTILVGNNTINSVYNSTSISISSSSTVNAVVNTSGMYVNSIPLQTIQKTYNIDFGNTAVFTTRGTITDARVTTNSTFTTAVSIYPSGANSLANGTSNTSFYGDELEMDTFQCSAYVATNGTINYYITAIPGPVANTRIFNYILS